VLSMVSKHWHWYSLVRAVAPCLPAMAQFSAVAVALTVLVVGYVRGTGRDAAWVEAAGCVPPPTARG
jgi:hypothetical protein